MKFLLCFFLSAPALAGTVHILSAADLQKNFSQYRILDARNDIKGEIPGARRVNWRDWVVEQPGFLGFGDATNWGKLSTENIPARMEALGISNDTPVAVVGDRKEWGEEGRIAWALLYWGVESVSLLDGGYDAWAALASAKVTPRPDDKKVFAVKLESWRRADLADVKGTTRPLLDARSMEEYHGKTLRGQARGGHLPGAVSVPLADLYQADGKYVTKEKLAGLVKVGDKSPIAYCTGGVRSALLALLLEARLGLRTANYDGSIWEWSAHKELPLIID